MKHRSTSRNAGIIFSKPWTRLGNGTLRIRWAAFAVWLGSACLCAWLSLAAALFFYIRSNSGYTEVRFSHVAGLPFTLNAYRKAKGDFFLKQGLEAAKNNQWRNAFDLLQIGLPTQPENEEARLLLARIYLMVRRPDQAKEVFLEGLKYRNDEKSDYIRTVLNFLFEQQADSTVMDIADALLIRNDLSSDLRNTLVLARLYAAFNQDRFEEARRSLAGTSLENSPQAKFIDIRISWERGLRQSALIDLRDLHARYPQDDEIYRTLQFYLSELGRDDEARRLALSRQLAFPAKPEPYLDFIRLCSDRTIEARRTTAIDDYLRLFGNEASSLLRLQTLAAQFGWNGLAWRIVALVPNDQMRERNTAAALAVEADLVGKAYAEAGQHAAEQLRQEANLTEAECMIFTGLEGLAYFGRGEEAEGLARINRVLSSGMVSSTTFSSLGRHLQSMGMIEMAERLFARAVEVDALNTVALVSLLQLKVETHTLDESLDLIERLPLLRKPSRQLMEDILNTLRSDTFLYVKNREPAIRSLENRVRLID